MLKRLARTLSLSLFAALPLQVLAAPVSITTSTSGITSSGSMYVLEALGIDSSNYIFAPFELTLQSTFDTAVTPPVRLGDTLTVADADITVTLRLGTGVFQQQGKGWAGLSSGPGAYSQLVGLYSLSSFDNKVEFSQLIRAPLGAAGNDPLAARSFNVSATDDIVGFMGVTYWDLDPEWPQSEELGGAATSGSILVSAVPEPSQWAMMAAGLVAGAVVARRRKQA